jgi:hypothetical protein
MDRATFKAVVSNHIRHNCGDKGFAVATFVTIREIFAVNFPLKIHF